MNTRIASVVCFAFVGAALIKHGGPEAFVGFIGLVVLLVNALKGGE